MTAPEHGRGSPARKRSVLLALRYYGRQMARLRRFTVPAMLLPALGNTCIYYVAPLIVAQLVGRLVGHGSVGIGAAMPYVLGFAGVLLFAEILWRIGIHCLKDPENRPALKKAGFLTRDPRVKERKKYGLKKADRKSVV